MRLQIDLTVKPMDPEDREGHRDYAYEAVAAECNVLPGHPPPPGRLMAIRGGSSPEIAASRAVRGLVEKVRRSPADSPRIGRPC